MKLLTGSRSLPVSARCRCEKSSTPARFCLSHSQGTVNSIKYWRVVSWCERDATHILECEPFFGAVSVAPFIHTWSHVEHYRSKSESPHFSCSRFISSKTATFEYFHSTLHCENDTWYFHPRCLQWHLWKNKDKKCEMGIRNGRIE